MAHNILLLIADDLGRMINAYGESTIETPHLDRLAAGGTLFDMAFTSTASCSGSRSVIQTGMHTHQNGQYGLGHDFHHFATFENVDTAPKLLADAGYRTGIIGKVHVGPAQTYPWEIREESHTRDVGWVASRAAAFFAQAATDKRPFYLTIGFVDPHRDATRAGFGNASFDGVPERLYRPEDMIVPDFLPDLPEVRLELANYSQSITRMDFGIGRILAALDQAGLADDTLVVFLSDNGSPFLNSKTTLFDAGVRLPLIMRKPGAPGGVRNPNLVSFIDLLPTFLDVAGHESHDARRRGRSLLPILSQNTRSADWEMVFGSHTFHEVTNYWPTRFIRTPRYKYHRNVAWKLDFPFSADLYSSLTFEAVRRANNMIGGRSLRDYVRRPAEELFDLDADPRELVNRAGDPAYAETLRILRKTMEDWQQATDDPWLFRDGMSLKSIAHQRAEGLQIVERWDMEI